jgi:hypothetical protein
MRSAARDELHCGLGRGKAAEGTTRNIHGTPPPQY